MNQQQPLSLSMSLVGGGGTSTEKNQSINRSSLNLSTADYATIGKKKQEPVYTEQELKECTFKPKISENSKLIFQDVTIDPVQERTRQILEQREKRLQQIRNQLEEKKQLTFKPSIADYSFKGKRTSFMDSIDEQIQKRKEFLEKCEKERKEKELQSNVATFTPQISETSKQLGIRGGNVFDRLSIPKEYNTEESDLYSTISKTPTKNLKFDDKLFTEAREREIKRKQIEETTREEEKKLKNTKVTEKSNEVLKSKMLKDLSSAFKSFDKQDRGIITKNDFEQVLSNLGLKAIKLEDLQIIENIWNLIDNENTNQVTFQQYNTIMLSILDNSFITLDQQSIRNQIEDLSIKVKKLYLNKLAYTKIDENRFEKVKKENDKELTFKPNISSSSSTTPKKLRFNNINNNNNTMNTTSTTIVSQSMDNTNNTNTNNNPSTDANTNNSNTSNSNNNQLIEEEDNEPRFLKLIKKQNELEERKKKEIEEWEKKKMEDCTFKPKTNSNKKLIGFQNYNSNRFDSLYNMAFVPKKLPNEKTREEKEMEQCTFKPNRSNTKKFEMKNLSKSVDFDSIRGIKETVGRLRKGNEERERLFTYFNNLRDKVQTSTEDYKNKKTSFKPFSFQLDKRKRSKPILYMDVNLGVGRCGRIGIHDGDKPEDLAFNFAQTYKIDSNLQQRLQDLIRQNMDENQHLFNQPNNNNTFINGQQHGSDDQHGNDNHQEEHDKHQQEEHGNEPMNQFDELSDNDELDENRMIDQLRQAENQTNDSQFHADLTIEDLNEQDNKFEDISKNNLANLSIYDESLEHHQQQPIVNNQKTTKPNKTNKPSSNTNNINNKASSNTNNTNNNTNTATTTNGGGVNTNNNRTTKPSYRSKTPTMKNSPTQLNEKRSKTPTTDRYQSNNKFKF